MVAAGFSAEGRLPVSGGDQPLVEACVNTKPPPSPFSKGEVIRILSDAESCQTEQNTINNINYLTFKFLDFIFHATFSKNCR